ncbi:MAG: phosphate transport regulator [Acidimicrobiia bacterium]
MRFRLIPTDDGFYRLFDDAAQNLAEGARNLRKLFVDFTDLEAKVEAVNACERRGDELTHAIVMRVNRSFVVPFDREDIHALTEGIDDAVDDLAAAADLIVLHHVDEPLTGMHEISDIIVDAADVAVSLVAKLPKLKNVQADLAQLGLLESTADRIYRRTTAELFSGQFDAFAVLKLKDLVEALERAVNSIEGIGDIVESIFLKHA